ncbi:MAG TPA: universal stress protein [Gemmataceae bacterium]|jgi:nucleotide-binding universal stress UspA family protein
MRLQTILHPADYDGSSDTALRYAVELAHDYKARLIVLHSVSTLGPENVTYGEVAGAKQPEEYRQRLWDEIHRIRSPDRDVPMEYVLSDDDPVAATLRFAVERKCDLIVVGSHGRHGVRRLLEGSVAEHVVRLAPCPVLVVKNENVSDAAPPAKKGTELHPHFLSDEGQ